MDSLTARYERCRGSDRFNNAEKEVSTKRPSLDNIDHTGGTFDRSLDSTNDTTDEALTAGMSSQLVV